MNVSQAVARVYARALVDLSGSGGADLGSIFDDLHAVRQLFDHERTFREFFASPRLDPAVKKRILSDALGDTIGRPVLGLLHVLIDKRREMVLDNIVDEFDRFRDLREGRLHVGVTAAQSLDPDQKDELKRRLETLTGQIIQIHERIDPRVLGGLIVKVGDRVIDGSLRRRLRRLRRDLVSVQGER